MDAIQTQTNKLKDLYVAGIISEQEFERRKKALIDQYMGDAPAANGTPVTPSLVPASPSFAQPPGRAPFPGRYMARGGVSGGMAMRGRGVTPQYTPPAFSFNRGGGYGRPMSMGRGFPMGGGGGYQMGGGGGRGYSMGRGFRGRNSFAPYPDKFFGSSTIKVQPLQPGTTEETLAAVFSQFGAVESAAVIPNGTPIYGYVNFFDADSAQRAAQSYSINLHGSTVTQITLAKKRKPPQLVEAGPSNGLGLFNIPFEMTQEELDDMLAQCPGFVPPCNMIRWPDTGAFKGFAFAYFDSVENATQARNTLQGLTIGDNHVDVKFANKGSM